MSTRVHIISNLTPFRIDVESQTTDDDDDEFYLQIKELIGVEEDNPEEIIDKIKELSQLVNDYK